MTIIIGILDLKQFNREKQYCIKDRIILYSDDYIKNKNIIYGKNCKVKHGKIVK